MGDRPLNSQQLLKALEIRESCYRLLNWLSDGISNGSVLPSPKRHAGSAKAAAHFISNNVYAPQRSSFLTQMARRYSLRFLGHS